MRCKSKCSGQGLVCNPASGRCVDPGGKIGRELRGGKKKFPADIDRELHKTLKSVQEFETLYNQEHGDLERNIKNGHTRGVLSRMFHAAKNSLAGLLSFMRKHPAFAVLIIAAMLYGGGSAIVMSRPESWLAKTLGTFSPKSLQDLPPSQFITKHWTTARNYVNAHGGSNFVATMNDFVGQLKNFSDYLVGKWTLLTVPIVELWKKLVDKLQEKFQEFRKEKKNHEPEYVITARHEQERINREKRGVSSLFDNPLTTPQESASPVIPPKKKASRWFGMGRKLGPSNVPKTISLNKPFGFQTGSLNSIQYQEAVQSLNNAAFRAKHPNAFPTGWSSLGRLFSGYRSQSPKHSATWSPIPSATA